MNMSEFIVGLRLLTAAKSKKIAKEVFGEEAGFSLNLYDSGRLYRSTATLCFFDAGLSTLNNPYITFTAGVYRPHIEFQPSPNSYSPSTSMQNMYKQVSNAFIAAEDVETALRIVLQKIADNFYAPVSRGCVKAYLGDNRLFWLSKRASSPKVALYNDNYYEAEGSYSFIKGYTSQDQWKWIHRDETINGTYLRHGDTAYHRSCFVEIYNDYDAETDRAGRVVRNELSWEASNVYRSYVRPGGSVIYTQAPLPYATYNKSPVHNYSTRIESLLEPCDLFRMGSVDLYSKRATVEVPFLGWELEACTNKGVGSDTTRKNTAAKHMKTLLNKVVICKNDGSIRPEGMETVSVPGTLDFWKEIPLADALNTMRAAPYNMRSFEHASCGFHVHVSRSALSVLDLQKLERFMHNPDNRSFLEVVAGRKDVMYAKYFPDLMFSNRATNNSKKSKADSMLYSESQLVSYYGPIPANMSRQFVLLCRTICMGFSLSVFSFHDKYENFLKTIEYATNRSYSHPHMSEEAFVDMLVDVVNRGELLPPVWTEWGLRPLLEDTIKKYYPEKAIESKKDHPLAGFRKSILPFKRVDNYLASQKSKGVVGKQKAGRYDVLNTGNKNTVEFRLFKGTMNPDSVYRYLEFVDAIVRFVSCTSASNEGVHFERFLEWLSKDSFNVIRYNNLVAFLVAKEFIQRKRILKRDLKVPQENDGSEPAPSEPPPPLPPPPVLAAEEIATVQSLVADDDDDDDDGNDDYEDESPCDCEDCRNAYEY